MRFSTPVAALLLLLFAPGGVAVAQNPECAGLPTAGGGRETCNVAIDLVRAYHPLAGLAISGGNPVLGTGGASGRLGSFSITLRANGFALSIPDLTNVGAGGPVPEDRELAAVAPLIEAHAGLFRGTDRGLFAVDLLGALQLVPNEKVSEEIRVDPDAARIGPVSLGTGFGVRVGILPDGAVLPGVSLSVMRRSIPRIGVGEIAAGDEVAADIDLRATTVRLTAGKTLGLLKVAGGVGWSRYTGDAVAQYETGLPGPGTITLELGQNRVLYFLDAGLDAGPVELVGEIGHQVGHDQGLGTIFTGYDDTKGTTFFSVGLRAGI